MGRVLGVVGSPRWNGNTHILVSRILDGAREAGAATDLTFLADLRIRECDGCHTCWHGRPCAKPDDMHSLYDRIAVSDAIVFGTPVYWYGPTALMKAFIDRFVYFNCPENRPKIRGKTVVLAIPFEEADAETAAPVVAFFERCAAYLEMRLAGTVLAPGVAKRGDVLERETCLEKARAIGRGLVEA